MSANQNRIIRILRPVILLLLLVVMIWYFINRVTFDFYSLGDPEILRCHFLTLSLLVAIIALLNLIDSYIRKDQTWLHYTLMLFIAMVFGTLGDFLMSGIIPISLDPLILGILAFSIGHIFYLLALKDLSPLLFSQEKAVSTGSTQTTRHFILRNLGLWISFMATILALFFLTVFNPTDLTLSIGALGYGLLFATVLAFAFTKLFTNQSISFRVILFVGFLLFFISDYILAVNRFTIPMLFSTLLIHATYIPGQLLIQFTPIIGTKNQS